jgi:hypothetical protein
MRSQSHCVDTRSLMLVIRVTLIKIDSNDSALMKIAGEQSFVLLFKEVLFYSRLLPSGRLDHCHFETLLMTARALVRVDCTREEVLGSNLRPRAA